MKYARKMHVIYITIKIVMFLWCVNISISATIDDPNSLGEEPEFVEQIENATVPVGRTVKLSCSVRNLGTYKVAWMHFEQSAILTVNNHVITRNPRITVTHDKHRTWYLHINNVQEADRGRYMCQLNTISAKTQFGYLNVVVPPNIDDSLSSSDVIVREGANVTLTCHASGYPQPTIKWRRDDGSNITLNKTHSVTEWEGNQVSLVRISRLDMGAYLCIASNNVPPSVSKRITVSVDFPPQLLIPHQLVSVPHGFNVTLECFTEAHPTSLNYWTRGDSQMIHDGKKYHTENVHGTPPFKVHMKLTIFNVNNDDLVPYKCVAKNPRGETDGTIRIYDANADLDENETHNSLYKNRDKNRKYMGGSDINQINKSEQKFGENKGSSWKNDKKSNSCSNKNNGFLQILLTVTVFGLKWRHS
ncbi:neurotrimin-like isoform X2 [Planococcus citri]|uniref:neurotrimin-like isoform X2 n=1 Tax=Planococcus citri TaxID=170843 RepID=UPI0031F915C5